MVEKRGVRRVLAVTLDRPEVKAKLLAYVTVDTVMQQDQSEIKMARRMEQEELPKAGVKPGSKADIFKNPLLAKIMRGDWDPRIKECLKCLVNHGRYIPKPKVIGLEGLLPNHVATPLT